MSIIFVAIFDNIDNFKKFWIFNNENCFSGQFMLGHIFLFLSCGVRTTLSKIAVLRIAKLENT